MGIQGFGTFLRKQNLSLFKPIGMSSLTGSTLAIDMHLYTYKMFYRSNGTNVLDDVMRFCNRLDKHDMKAYFIFDGSTQGLKPAAHQKRKEAFSQKVKNHETLTDELAEVTAACEEEGVVFDESRVGEGEGIVISTKVSPKKVKVDETKEEPVEAKEEEDEVKEERKALLLKKRIDLEEKMVKSSLYVQKPSRELFQEIKDYLSDRYGDPYVLTAQDDAERLCAIMCKDGKVEYVISSDYDTLAFGSPNLVIEFASSKMQILHLEEILTELNMTLPQFIDFSILCGCDYCGKVPGIGPKRALAYIKAHKTIEGAFDEKLAPRFSNPTQKDEFCFEFARKRFNHEELPVVDITEEGAEDGSETVEDK